MPVLEIGLDNGSGLLERMGSDVPNDQYIRELQKNAEEAGSGSGHGDLLGSRVCGEAAARGVPFKVAWGPHRPTQSPWPRWAPFARERQPLQSRDG